MSERDILSGVEGLRDTARKGLMSGSRPLDDIVTRMELKDEIIKNAREELKRRGAELPEGE